jgi:hypothetical protein
LVLEAAEEELFARRVYAETTGLTADHRDKAFAGYIARFTTRTGERPA